MTRSRATSPPDARDEDLAKRFENRYRPSNEILPDYEQNVIRKLISESQSSLDSLEEEIYSIEKTLQALNARCIWEKTRMKGLLTGIAPHKTLPPEILSMIFLYTVGEGQTHMRWRARECPWNVIQVCSRWRAIAMSETRLWSTMILIVSQRQKPSTLPTQTPPQVHQSLQSVIVQVTQESVNLGFILSPFRGCRTLRNITLQSRSTRALRLQNIGFLDAFPCTQLRNLDFLSAGISPITFLEILRRSINLFTAEVTFNPQRILQQNVPVYMPHLQSLRVHAQHTPQIHNFFRALTTPLLEKATISAEATAEEQWSSNELALLVNRSGCSLKKLVIKHLYFPPQEIDLLLPHLPELISLEIDVWEPTPEYTINLIRQNNLVPNLETLHVRVASLHASHKLLEARYQGLHSRKNRKMCNIKLEALMTIQNEWESFRHFIEQNKDEGRRIRIVWIVPDSDTD